MTKADSDRVPPLLANHPFSLEGRIVIVTGGAGHLGAEISRGLAVAGATVHAIGRDGKKLVRLLEFNENFSSQRIFVDPIDVEDEVFGVR